MNIASTTAGYIDGNRVFRLKASDTGNTNIIKWDYESNGFNLGSEFQIKLKILPSIKTFNFYGEYTIEESVYPGIYNEINKILPYRVIGIDNYGNYMCSNNGKFMVVDKNLNQLLVINGINAICSQQTNNDNYIILDEQASRIVEISNSGEEIYIMSEPEILNYPKNFVYDDLTNNLLVSGGKKHAIYELSWNNNDKGTVIWQHGTKVAGSGSDELSYPTAVSYDINRQIVYVADSGNKRIKKIDRSGLEESVEIIDGFSRDDAAIGLNTILNIHPSSENIIFVESEQENEKFNEDIYLHPSLSRALHYNRDNVSSKNKLLEYENLLFAPVIWDNFDKREYIKYELCNKLDGKTTSGRC